MGKAKPQLDLRGLADSEVSQIINSGAAAWLADGYPKRKREKAARVKGYTHAEIEEAARRTMAHYDWRQHNYLHLEHDVGERASPHPWDNWEVYRQYYTKED